MQISFLFEHRLEQRDKFICYEVAFCHRTGLYANGIIFDIVVYGIIRKKIKFEIIFVKQRRTTTNTRLNSFIFIKLNNNLLQFISQNIFFHKLTI